VLVLNHKKKLPVVSSKGRLVLNHSYGSSSDCLYMGGRGGGAPRTRSPSHTSRGYTDDKYDCYVKVYHIVGPTLFVFTQRIPYDEPDIIRHSAQIQMDVIRGRTTAVASVSLLLSWTQS
jgi:hypothetical protein